MVKEELNKLRRQQALDTSILNYYNDTLYRGGHITKEQYEKMKKLIFNRSLTKKAELENHTFEDKNER